MRVLLTGSAGFIGYHTACSLLKAGHEVIGYDNFNSYYDPQLKEYRTAKIIGHDNYRLYRADLCDYQTLEKLFQEEKPEIICHLAAQAGVRYSLENPFVYLKANLEGFLNIMELARHHNIKKVVYASSSSVYGGLREAPFRENMVVDTPVSLYAATKKSNELIAHTYSHLYNFTTVGLRFFTVYGPCSRPDMAPWLFTEAITQGKPIKVFNHGDMKRDFTFVDDIVEGVISALFTDLPDKYHIFNLGNHRSEQLLSLIKAIETSIGKKAETIMLPMQPGDVKETYADISKAQALLNYQPKTILEKGIAQFITWYKEYTA